MKTDLPDFDELWNFEDPAATEPAFVALLPAFRESGDTGKYVELISQIARAHSLRGQFAEAHSRLDGVVGLLETCGPRGKIRYLLERGRTFNSAGEPAEALPLFERAWEIGVAAHEDRLAIDAAHMLAIAAPTGEQLGWTEKGLALVERTTDPAARNWLGPLYNNAGYTHLEAGRAEDALDAFRKGLAFRLEKDVARPIRIARYAVGRALRALGREGEALPMQTALRAEWIADGGVSAPYVDEEIGECMLLLGHPSAEAAPFFAFACSELSKDSWLVEHEPDRLARLKKLGTANPGGHS